MAMSATTVMSWVVLHADEGAKGWDSDKTAMMTEGFGVNLAGACVDHHRWTFGSGHRAHLTPAPGSDRGPPICLKLWKFARTARGQRQAEDLHSLSSVHEYIVEIAILTKGFEIPEQPSTGPADVCTRGSFGAAESSRTMT